MHIPPSPYLACMLNGSHEETVGIVKLLSLLLSLGSFLHTSVCNDELSDKKW